MADPVSFEDYQLAQNNPDSFTIQHPDGTQFQVAKDGLDPDYVSHVEQNMPKYAASPGGVIEIPANAPGPGDFSGLRSIWNGAKDKINKFTDDSNATFGIPPMHPELQPTQPAGPGSQVASAGGGPIGVVPGALPPDTTPSMGMADNSGATQAGQVPGVAYGNPNDPMSMWNAAYQNQLGGAQGQYDVAKQVGAQSAAALQSEQDEMNRIQQERQARMEDMYNKNTVLSNQVANGQIDPNRVWNNMGTGNQILASIAMIAGGLGQGLMRSNTNPALDVINNAVNRDIDAQKHNLDNKRSLLGMNLEQSRNIDEAASHAMINAHAIVNGQIQQAIANTASPQAKANLQNALAPIQQSMAQTIQQHNLLYPPQGQGQQISQGGLPQGLVARISMMPKETQAPLMAEAASATKTAEAKKAITNIIGQMKQINTVGALASPEAYRQKDALGKALVMAVQTANGNKRPSEEAQKLVEPFMGSTLKTPAEYNQNLGLLLQQVDQDSPGTPLMKSLGWIGQPGSNGNAQQIAARQSGMKVSNVAKR